MPLNIKNEEAHRLARELARRRGVSITRAVSDAIADALKRAESTDQISSRRLVSELDAIALQCASLEVKDRRSAEEIVGYDENGAPM